MTTIIVNGIMAAWLLLIAYRTARCVVLFFHGFATEFRKEFVAAITPPALPANVLQFRKREEKKT